LPEKIRKPLSRSENMSRIRCKDTKPEFIIRRGLHAAGFRFRLHRRDLPGTPDLVLKRFNVAMFVHGCFWHAHSGCRNFKIPGTRTDFWKQKLLGNKARDETNIVNLLGMGWRVFVVWECATRKKNAAELIQKITLWLQSPEKFGELSAQAEEIKTIIPEKREPRTIE